MPSEKWNVKANVGINSPSTIGGINLLPREEIRCIYARIVPREMVDFFKLSPDLYDEQGNDLLTIACSPGGTTIEVSLYHQHGAPDPVLYGQLADTLNGQIHILFYAINDPHSPRFDVDRMPDGKATLFGTLYRNLQAEEGAMQAGLAPAQIRRGLRLLGACLASFEEFVKGLGHGMFFAEPLHYHNAVVFERHGLAYQQGRALMERIHNGFLPGGDLLTRLDGSTLFRSPQAASSLRLRSWAIYDGILGEPFRNVTMYRIVGKPADVNTCAAYPELVW